MKFKDYINEEQELVEGTKEDIIQILDSMSDGEISEFGEFIDNSLEDGDEFDEDTYTKEEVIELLGSLDSGDLDYALYMLGGDEDTENNSQDNSIYEKTSRVMKASNRNKGKKRFTKTKAELRKGKAARKKENRKNKVEKKKYRLKNKVNLKKYAKSYSAAVKSGKHKVKIRR